MGFEIREMELKDFMGVISLIKNDLGYDDISSDIYDRIMRIFHNESYTTFVAEIDGNVIGFMGLMRGLAFEMDGEYVRVIALAVSSAYRSTGGEDGDRQCVNCGQTSDLYRQSPEARRDGSAERRHPEKRGGLYRQL